VLADVAIAHNVTLAETYYRVTACLKNLEISANLAAKGSVRQMSTEVSL